MLLLKFSNRIIAVKRNQQNCQMTDVFLSKYRQYNVVLSFFCRGHIEDVYDLCWSPDGNNLISGSVDNSAIIWDIVKGVYIFFRIIIACHLKMIHVIFIVINPGKICLQSFFSVRSKACHFKGPQTLCARCVLGSTWSICGDKFQWQVITCWKFIQVYSNLFKHRQSWWANVFLVNKQGL